jgi:hypothetical protein
MDQLRVCLLDLIHELAAQGISITIGGGYGLYLKRQYLISAGQRMLFDQLPAERSTNDLDLFLRVEVVADPERFGRVKEVIHQQGYLPVQGAEFLQWKRKVLIGGITQEVKVDVLVGPLGEHRHKLHVSSPRVRPKGKRLHHLHLHAHAVEEAVCIEDRPIAVPLTGLRSTGEACANEVFVPQAFPYLMMKLHAFADREAKGQTVKAQHHALDLYTIAGMMTEPEYEQAKELGAAHASVEPVQRARTIVGEHFSAKSASGIIRIQEHALYRDDFQLAPFSAVLAEVFGVG